MLRGCSSVWLEEVIINADCTVSSVEGQHAHRLLLDRVLPEPPDLSPHHRLAPLSPGDIDKGSAGDLL